jgi:hypothetical protein
MASVRDRWELLEPVLFSRYLSEPASFERADTARPRGADVEAFLEKLVGSGRFDRSAIAQAFGHLGVDSPLTLGLPEEPIHSVIGNFGQRLLRASGDHWALRMTAAQPGHEIVRWRGVTMLVPQSIVVAGALSRTNRSHPCRVQVLPESVAPRVPVGHLHVHLGPLLPFEALWTELSNAFLQRGTLDSHNGRDGIDAIRSGDLPEIGRCKDKRRPGSRWQWMLELALMARVWLALKDSQEVPIALTAFGRGRVDIERRASALLAFWSAGTLRDEARHQARAFVDAQNEDDRRRLRLRNVENLSSRYSDDEVAFLAACLRRCLNDKQYARVFYQYLRVKVALYRCLVVDPWTTGLRHFLDVVQRDEPYTHVIDARQRLNDLRLDCARSEKPLKIGALEIHLPPKSWLKQRRRVDQPHSWVLSFVRAEQHKGNDPTGARGAMQWRRCAAEASTMCRVLARYIRNRPSVLRELRGLGVMSWERNGPVWLFEVPFKRLIDASAEVAASHPRLELRSIQTALHVGEDFDHLLSGLRQIYEPFEWGLVQRGDRVGHALALGLSLDEWCQRNPWVRMRPWDRILDIGFAYWALDTLKLHLESDCLEQMRIDARDALRRVFQGDEPALDPLEVARSIWLALPRTPPRMSAHGATTSASGILASAHQLKARILDDRACGRRALELSLPVETKHDLGVLRVVHEAVHNCVAKWQVAIEVNPSSNLLIGGFRSIFEQPTFHTSELPITLNTDDPLTFGTALADEYAYAWAGMVVGSGQSPEVATRRLEDAARSSMRYVFTTPRTDNDPKKR